MKKKDTILRNIPNMLTILRIALVALFALYFSKRKYTESIIIYACAFISDVLDGFLARKFNWITSVGKLLDPLADKFMLITALVCFANTKIVPVWVLAVIAMKELSMCVCGLMLYKRGVVVEADIMGKISTGLWTGTIVLTLIQNTFLPELQLVAQIALSCAVISSLIALCNYFVDYFVKQKSLQ